MYISMELAVATLCVCVFILGVLVDRVAMFFYRKFVDSMVEDEIYVDEECVVT